MTSIRHLRDFIKDRLNAAAEEIFSEFEKTIVFYEEEIDRQRRQQELTWNPVITLQHADLSQHHVFKAEEDLADQQLYNHSERNSGLDQEIPEPPQIKEEQEEPCTSQEELCFNQQGEQLVLKQETDTFLVTPVPEEPSTSLSINSAFSTDSNFTLKTITLTGEKLYLCNTCGKTFNTMFSFKRHNRIHTGEKPFSCKLCGRSFRQKYPLTVHMRAHTGELPYICNTCGKGYKDITALKRHMQGHTGEKPHLCNTCGKRFKEKSTLRVHLRIHTGELPHLCNICGKKFKDITALKRHMQGHTGEKPHICSTCGKRFKEKSTLRVHWRIHTAGTVPS